MTKRSLPPLKAAAVERVAAGQRVIDLRLAATAGVGHLRDALCRTTAASGSTGLPGALPATARSALAIGPTAYAQPSPSSPDPGLRTSMAEVSHSRTLAQR
jgi:hypothetical protein